MKLSQISRRHSGFSMIELMVVVGIMVVLAGLLIGSLPGIHEPGQPGQCGGLHCRAGSGLSSYQIDNGSYPLNEADGDRDKVRDRGAAILYKHLSGDWDLDGKVDFDQQRKGLRHETRLRQQSRIERAAIYRP